MIWDDEGGAQQRQQEHTKERNGRTSERQRQRLAIYRLGVERTREKRAAGVPAIQAAWRVACDLSESFTLDTCDAGMLAGCLVLAARGE